jgi:hypothetical protein
VCGLVKPVRDNGPNDLSFSSAGGAMNRQQSLAESHFNSFSLRLVQLLSFFDRDFGRNIVSKFLSGDLGRDNGISQDIRRLVFSL